MLNWLGKVRLGNMGVRKGGQEGALDPHWLAKIVCFLTIWPSLQVVIITLTLLLFLIY